jgi:hypothetical protein
MTITHIEETEVTQQNQAPRFNKACGRQCIYFAEAVCRTPNLQFKICLRCPRATEYVKTNVVQSLFERIKAFAFGLMDKMHYLQSSK